MLEFLSFVKITLDKNAIKYCKNQGFSMKNEKNMKISIVQFSPVLFNREVNIEYVINQLTKDNSDIIVFPELCLSGYYFLNKQESLENAMAMGSKEMQKFAALARELNKIIVLGFAELSQGEVFNSAALLFPEPAYNAAYRKTHLFYKEHEAFSEGDSGFFVVDYKPWDIKIGTMICYDWRFPEAARSLGLLGADLIVCPSNLVTPLWPRVMPARAIENKVYLAVANRTGSETREGEKLIFNGQSAVYDFSGDALVQADFDGDAVITCEIEPQLTRDKSFNPINHIFNDRRVGSYKALF